MPKKTLKSSRKIVVCRAKDLLEKKSMTFSRKQRGKQSIEGFVVRWNGSLHAYINRCPHAGTTLDYGDNDFFTEDGLFLMCRTHGALFQPDDGACAGGPCNGQGLEPVTVSEMPNGNIVVQL